MRAERVNAGCRPLPTGTVRLTSNLPKWCGSDDWNPWQSWQHPTNTTTDWTRAFKLEVLLRHWRMGRHAGLSISVYRIVSAASLKGCPVAINFRGSESCKFWRLAMQVCDRRENAKARRTFHFSIPCCFRSQSEGMPSGHQFPAVVSLFL